MRKFFSTFLSLSLVLSAWSCRPERAAPDNPLPKAGQPVTESDTGNRLGFFNGAVIVNRTGELSLEMSALNAVDGDDGTLWSTPPGDVQQSMTIALPARSRIDQVGLSNGNLARKWRAVQRLRFEGSDDGTVFRLLKDIEVETLAQHQLTRIEPADVNYMRVSILSSFNSKEASDVVGIEARGRELEPPARGLVSGVWSLNGETARFAGTETIFHGVVETSPPTYIEGGWDGRIMRFLWFRGEEYGFGLLSVDTRSEALNGFLWYREPIQPFLGGPWFGEKKEKNEGAVPAPRVIETFLQHSGRVPVYQIEFDERNRVLPGSDASPFQRALRLHPRGMNVNLHEVCTDPSARAPNERMNARARALEAFLVKQGIDSSLIRFKTYCDSPKADWPATLLTQPFTRFVEIDLRPSR